MLLDHLAWAFIETASLPGQICHLIGRVTAPVMCYFIAEGYFHTRNIKRYALRLGIFALISWPCYSFFQTGRWFSAQFGMIWTLLTGLLALWSWKHLPSPFLRLSAAAACCILSLWGDWPLVGVLFILVFGLNRQPGVPLNKRQAIGFSILSLGVLVVFPTHLFHLGLFLALPFLALYNGERGGSGWMKWGFYLFYPLHLLALGLGLV